MLRQAVRTWTIHMEWQLPGRRLHLRQTSLRHQYRCAAVLAGHVSWNAVPRLRLRGDVYNNYFFLPGEKPWRLKNYKRKLRNLFGSEPTLAGRHQQNDHATKPN